MIATKTRAAINRRMEAQRMTHLLYLQTLPQRRDQDSILAARPATVAFNSQRQIDAARIETHSSHQTGFQSALAALNTSRVDIHRLRHYDSWHLDKVAFNHADRKSDLDKSDWMK